MDNTQAQQPQANSMFDYQDDTAKQISMFFGGNLGKTFMTKFEWIPNGGKEGAEMEAIDITFNINGTDRSYRRFLVTSAFDDNNNTITDPNHPKFKDAVSTWNAVMTHIAHAYENDVEKIKIAFTRPINGLKQYVEVFKSLLPANFAEIPLDIFLQYQWQLKKDAEITFLEIPPNMKHGPWLKKAVPGNWKEIRVPNPDDKVTEALFYVNLDGAKDAQGNPIDKHPFTRTGWYMNSNFANQIKTNGNSAQSQTNANAAAAIHNDGATAATTGGAAATNSGKASAW